MTMYERARLLCAPFLPLLYSRVRGDLKRILKAQPQAHLLDVGGRQSQYTIGLSARIVVTDIPPASDVQRRLHLGMTVDKMAELHRNRSNIHKAILDDMTRSKLPSASFDGVVCVEVIEHVLEDEIFVSQIARVLKPGGFLYLTTPNGDYVKNEPPNYNPDHVRHYTRVALTELLHRHFGGGVTVGYGIKTGKHRWRGQRGPSPLSAASNLVNRWESKGLDEQPRRTAHLFGVAYNKG